MTDDKEEQTDMSDFGGDDIATDATSVSETVAGKNTGEYTEIGSNDADSADNIDPRKLVGDVHINDIRWLYRNTFVKTLVDKPVNDAFKNGLDIIGDEDGTIDSYLDDLDYIDKYKTAQKKARRDGFSVLFFVLEDSNDAAWQSPENVSEIKSINVYTLDDLYTNQNGVRESLVEDKIPDDVEKFETRGTGLIINKDPTSADYNEVIGYVMDYDEDSSTDPTVVSADRCQHFTWNKEVDGDLEDDNLGETEGESTILQYYNLMRGVSNGNWALMNTIFRYSAKLYSIQLPEGADEEDMKKAEKQFQSINSKSETVLPPNYEMEDYQTDGQLDPAPYFEIVFKQICACTEMTKSVLFGTQAGTVSGSETDIKNYFNKVERIRQNRFNEDLNEFIELIREWGSEEPAEEYNISWMPMFKLSAGDRASAIQTLAQAGGTLINGFAMTPEELREILQQEWADMGVEFELSELSDEEMELLENINIGQVGRDPDAAEPSEEGEGGMEQGQQTASNDPTTDEDNDNQ